MSHTLTKITLPAVDGGEERDLTIIGTAHISEESVKEVGSFIRENKPECVCIELDEGRLSSMENKEKWESLDIIKVLKEKKGFLLLANLVLASFQKKLGQDVGVAPGDEMREALNAAKETGSSVALVDRPIAVTLRRAWAKNSFWGKSKLLSVLVSSAFSKEEISKEEIEKLKNQNEMDSMMSELSSYLPRVKEVLIDERDRYLATKIFERKEKTSVAVLGAGHVPGVLKWLEALSKGEISPDVSDISTVPEGGIGGKILQWLIPLLIIALIGCGFLMKGGETSVDMLLSWLLWNGSLAAAGTVLALGNPLAVITSFVMAPIGTLNPFLAVGLFSALVQAWIRKPRVKDMQSLSEDATSVKGFYRNRITHVLLVFFLSSLGGAIGNIISFPAMISKLF